LRVLRLAEAGIAGSRSWLTYLATGGEDPKLANAVLDQEGKITGNDRLKCTFVVEFLNEHAELLSLGEKTRAGTREAFEQAWGAPFAAFEERWKRWLLGPPPSILERLEPAKPRPVAPDEATLLRKLNEVRRRCFEGSVCGDAQPGRDGPGPAELLAFDEGVEIDAALSEGAAKHARYLKQNPSQLQDWPSAHEEWPDRAEFSPEGSWAGMHSVILPGVSTPDAALTRWLATFYHRLPLLHPGLLRVGWASNDQVSVLDAGSLARPVLGSWHVVWPHDGMTDVPVLFEPEFPSPVPGVEGPLGHPVTLQVGGQAADEAPPSIVVELREGTPAGPRVNCHVSSPSEPSNPDVAISDAWCLIPAAPLKRTTNYHVTARWSTGRKIAWSFKTGKQRVPQPVDDELGPVR
jgi:hypothetical protein